MTMNIGLASKAFASALPASASRLFRFKFSVVILVFTYHRIQRKKENQGVTLKMGKSTSSDLAIALPPSGPRWFRCRFKSVSEVFNCMIEKKTKK